MNIKHVTDRLSRAHPPIGLDLGTEGIRAAQVLTQDGRARLEWAGYGFSRDARNDPSLRLRETVRFLRELPARGFAGRHVVASLPPDVVHIRTLRLPPMPREELQWAVETEARELLPFDPSSALVKYLHAGEVKHSGETRHEVLLVAVCQRDVDGFVDLLDSAGMVIDAVEPGASAVFRAATWGNIRNAGSDDTATAVLDFGSARSRVYYGRGQKLQFVRNVEVGGSSVKAAVARKLGVTPDEAHQLRLRLGSTSGDAASESVRKAIHDACRGLLDVLAREVEHCLRYCQVTFRGKRPEQVLLIGSAADDRPIRAMLQGALSLPAVPLKLPSLIEPGIVSPAATPGEAADIAVALGLALSETPVSGMADESEPVSAAEVVHA